MSKAVILSGYLRTWHRCKENIVNTITDLYGTDIDWFISVWKSNTSSLDEIKQFIESKGHRVVSKQWLDPADNKLIKNYVKKDGNHYDVIPFATIGPSYQRRVANLVKRKLEFTTGVRYTTVLFVRPDVVFYTNNSSMRKITSCLYSDVDFALRLGGDYNDFKIPLSNPSAQDLFPVAGLLSSDLLGHMYIDANDSFGNMKQAHVRGGICAHSWLSSYVMKHIITTANDGSNGMPVGVVIVRPSTNIDNESFNKWDDKVYGILPDDNWGSLTDDQRRELCVKFGIDIRDY